MHLAQHLRKGGLNSPEDVRPGYALSAGHHQDVPLTNHRMNAWNAQERFGGGPSGRFGWGLEKRGSAG